LDDLSPRVRDALTRVKQVVAEDTRVYKELMKLAGLPLEGVKLHALHDHNQADLARPMEWLDAGLEVLLVSDAGSPLISDPAYPLVRTALAAGHGLDTLPGPSSVLVALELSGLPPHPFAFHGFMARESGKRKSFFESTNSFAGTHIVFEAPHRIISCVDDLCSVVAPETEIAIARELTKKFQSVYRFVARDWEKVKSEVMVKGEFVLLYHHAQVQKSGSVDSEMVELAKKFLQKPTTKLSAKLIAKILDQDARDIYDQLSKRD
tara:strand:- start:7069 stop:7860 length:792 start_codon:yes stop_codon:yes gene_type:complete